MFVQALMMEWTLFQEAVQCLNDHTQKIKIENRELRHELLLLIRKTRALHEHQQHLLDQKKQLELEQQYSQDLKHLRCTRQHKVLKSLGLLDESEDQVSTAQWPNYDWLYIECILW